MHDPKLTVQLVWLPFPVVPFKISANFNCFLNSIFFIEKRVTKSSLVILTSKFGMIQLRKKNRLIDKSLLDKVEFKEEL